MTSDPFRALGLSADQDLTDDDVRAAWRRIAAETHPDRADGGDPTAFATAAAAYSDLRTRFGRGEALADLTAAPGGRGADTEAGRGPGGRDGSAGSLAGRAARWTARVRHGRPARLSLRVLAAAAVSAAVVAVAGWQPPSLALITGALTWAIRSGRHDLAARPPARPGSNRRGRRSWMSGW